MQIEQDARTPRLIIVERSCNTEDISTRPSTTVVSYQLVVETTPVLSDEVCKKLWEVESKIFLKLNLHLLYETHMDLLLVMVWMDQGALLSRDQFQFMWRFYELSDREFVRLILVRKHLKLVDHFATFVFLEDIGSKIYLYYASYEKKLQSRQALGRQLGPMNVDWFDYDIQIIQIFYHQSRESLHGWRASLAYVLLLLLDKDQLSAVLRGTLRPVYNLEVLRDFTGSYYLQNWEKAIDWIERYLHAIKVKKPPVSDAHAQVKFLVAPPVYCLRQFKTIDIKVEGLMATRCYLEHSYELFDEEDEQLVRTWSVLTCIHEDYGLSRTKTVAADLVYRRISGAWTFELPPTVQAHSRFCSGAKKHKQTPDSTIALVKYNWLQIHRAHCFNTRAQIECREVYQRFFEEHRTHHDPVYLRAAMYCAALEDWCPR